MSWFYAINEDRFGPISSEELADLSRQGKITADSPAWKEGMAEWLPFRQVADEVFNDDTGKEASPETGVTEASPSPPLATATCAFSNRVLPTTELVPYGDRWIDPQHKDAFVQQLMESGKLEGEAAPERDRIPVGFWWRLLSYVIDTMITMVPSMLCFIPFWISSIGTTLAQDPTDPNPFAGWTAVMGITYALGMLGSLLVQGGYHTWMLGRYRATVGKMAIGAVVANPDGGRLSYGRSLGRWLSQIFINGIIGTICVWGAVFFGAMIMGALVAASGADPSPGIIMGGTAVFLGAIVVGTLIGMFPYWMAGFDSEKRALHDRICSTRVIKKPLTP